MSDAADKGDVVAARFLLGRVWLPKKVNPTPITIPKIESAQDALKAIGAILSAEASGELDLDAAARMIDTIKTALNAVEGGELEQKVRELIVMLECK
jgi:hypothetical protein